MTDSKTPAGSHPGASPEAAPASPAVQAALEAVHGLLERAAIYPGGHPAVDRAADRARERLAAAWAEGDPLCLEVRAGVLSANGAEAASAPCRQLAHDLLELDIVGLELGSAGAPEDLVAFAADVAEVRTTGGSRAARDRWQSDGGPLRVTLLDYAALRFEDGIDTDADPERIRAALERSLLAAPGADPAPSPEQLAEQLGQELGGADAVGVLGGQIQQLLDEIGDLPGDSRRDAHARVGEFLVALPRELRDDLLRIDSRFDLAPGDAESPLRPESLVTTLLFRAVRSSARPPEDAVALMNQLLRTSSIDPDRKLELGRLVPEGDGDPTPEQLEELAVMVREVFLKREDIQANPQDYQELIDQLASVGVLEHADLDELLRRYRDPASEPEMLGHAVEIAALQFDGAGADEHAEGVITYLQEATERLLAGNGAGPFAAAVESVHAYAGRSGVSAAAAEDYLSEALSEPVVHRALAALPRNETPPAAIAAYLRLAGPAALEPALDALAADPCAPVQAVLSDALQELPPDRLLAAVRNRADRGWKALRPVFPVLERIGGARAAALLEDLLNHADERVRTRALAALTAGDVDGDRLEELLYPLLRDRSPRLVRAALRKLGELSGQDAVDLLGSFVLGRFAPPDAEAAVDLRLLAVRVLTLKGAAGWRCLGQCLSRLGWRLKRSDVLTARAIADAVRARHDGPIASRMLRGWNLSPARWIGSVVVRGGTGKAKL